MWYLWVIIVLIIVIIFIILYLVVKYYLRKIRRVSHVGEKAIIIGASSGIGRGMAIELAKHGYEVGLCARRVKLLKEVASVVRTKAYVKKMDLTDDVESVKCFKELIDEMGGLDLVFVSSGIGTLDVMDWKKQRKCIQVNILGYSAIVCTAWNYFMKMGKGHIVGVTSITGNIGIPQDPMYSSSKGFASLYLQALGSRTKLLKKKRIHVTEVQPGYVKTATLNGMDNLCWVSSVEKCCKQMYDAIENKSRLAYITKRWMIVAWLMRIVPTWLFDLCNRG